MLILQNGEPDGLQLRAPGIHISTLSSSAAPGIMGGGGGGRNLIINEWREKPNKAIKHIRHFIVPKGHFRTIVLSTEETINKLEERSMKNMKELI